MPRGDSPPARARSMSAVATHVPPSALGLGVGQIGEQLAIAARDVRRQCAVHEDDGRTDGPRWSTRRRRRSREGGPFPIVEARSCDACTERAGDAASSVSRLKRVRLPKELRLKRAARATPPRGRRS